MQRVMRMPDLEVRDHLDRLKASHFQAQPLEPKGSILKEC